LSTAAGPSGSEEGGIDLDAEFRAELRELARSLPQLTYYELLELPRSADAAAVRDGFFQQSKRYHPDRYFRRNIGPYRDLINEIYKRVVAAHDVLRDPEQRASYDLTLGPESAFEAEPSTQTRTQTRTSTTPPTPTPRTPTRPAAPAAPPPAAPKPAPSLRSRSGLRSRRHLLGGLENQIQLAKSKAERRYQEAMVRREAGAWAEAASLLRMAMAFAPREERYRKAFEDLAPLANAEQARALRARAELLRAQGNRSEALELLLECCEREPTDGELANRVARMLCEGNGDLERGLELSRRALSLDEKSLEFRRTLARLLKARGDKKGARREYQKIWKQDPLDAEAKRELA
jgi:curved DNA-binding protein CbpA